MNHKDLYASRTDLAAALKAAPPKPRPHTAFAYRSFCLKARLRWGPKRPRKDAMRERGSIASIYLCYECMFACVHTHTYISIYYMCKYAYMRTHTFLDIFIFRLVQVHIMPMHTDQGQKWEDPAPGLALTFTWPFRWLFKW